MKALKRGSEALQAAACKKTREKARGEVKTLWAESRVFADFVPRQGRIGNDPQSDQMDREQRFLRILRFDRG